VTTNEATKELKNRYIFIMDDNQLFLSTLTQYKIRNQILGGFQIWLFFIFCWFIISFVRRWKYYI